MFVSCLMFPLQSASQASGLSRAKVHSCRKFVAGFAIETQAPGFPGIALYGFMQNPRPALRL